MIVSDFTIPELDRFRAYCNFVGTELPVFELRSQGIPLEEIADELESAKGYMETALEYKATGNANRYGRYKEMSMQELAHAMTLHEYAAQDIEQLKTVYPDIPQEMQDKWDRSHVEYVEKSAWIKQMQAM